MKRIEKSVCVRALKTGETRTNLDVFESVDIRKILIISTTHSEANIFIRLAHTITRILFIKKIRYIRSKRFIFSKYEM